MSALPASTAEAEIASVEPRQMFPLSVYDEEESVGYEGLLVKDIEDVTNILLNHTSITMHKDFVLRLGQRLCPAQLRSQKVTTDQVVFVGNHALADSCHDLVMVDKQFLDCIRGSIFCCEAVLSLGPAWVEETPVQKMTEVLLRVVAEAERSIVVSYYPRVYLDDVLSSLSAENVDETIVLSDGSLTGNLVHSNHDAENTALVLRDNPGYLDDRNKENMPPKENQPAMAPEPTEEPSPRQTAAQTAEGNTSLPGGPGPADYYLAGGYLPATPPPAPAQSNTTTSSTSQHGANTATPSGPGHRPQPRNNAPALSRQSAQKVQDFYNQTMNTFNRGKSKIERFVWVPTRVPYTHAGFMNASPATWANDWRELVRERDTAGEWYSPPMEEENEDEE